jgi:hypothetical protein
MEKIQHKNHVDKTFNMFTIYKINLLIINV